MGALPLSWMVTNVAGLGRDEGLAEVVRSRVGRMASCDFSVLRVGVRHIWDDAALVAIRAISGDACGDGGGAMDAHSQKGQPRALASGVASRPYSLTTGISRTNSPVFPSNIRTLVIAPSL